MKVSVFRWFLVFVLSVHFGGRSAGALPYDYSATIQCLDGPLKPQYRGGIIQNPEFSSGLQGWSTFGGGQIENRESNGGNKFVVSHSRSQPYDSVSQNLYMRNTKLYTFSAWVQVSEGHAPVIAVFKTKSGYIHAGSVVAKSGCWSMLKGGLTVNVSGPAELYFETKDTKVEVWVDSVSLQPFTEQEWKSHHTQSIEKERKKKVKIQVKDVNGTPIPNAKVSLFQTKSSFPFGCAISKHILTNLAYQRWFTSRRFAVTTFANEMKWYTTERVQGREDYSLADRMLAFAKRHGILVRGHNVFWDDPKYQMSWVNALSKDQLNAATERRISSVMSRYKGKLIAWDVVNEMLHFNYFESKLGSDASLRFYKRATQLDSGTTLFMNDYNTLEEPGDPNSKPDRYIQKMNEVSAFVGGRQHMAIGLEGHFHTSNIPYMRSALDVVAASGYPIWLTEVDVSAGNRQAEYLEEVLREAHAHPAVKGIVIWGAWQPEGCDVMCLTDNNFRNLPTGDVVDRLLSEWRSHPVSPEKNSTTTDDSGFFETMLFHGDYGLTVTNASSNLHLTTASLSVSGHGDGVGVIHIRV